MIEPKVRISWDTTVKHYVRKGLFDNLPEQLKPKISSSNKSRWKNELDDKYVGCELAEYINQELELIKRVGQSTKVKKLIETYFKLSDTFHEVLANVKKTKQTISNQKELIINTIENVKEHIPIENALRIFNISRATYQNYKIVVKNKCEQSYFLWCIKRYPHQLLKKEILQIKKYMDHDDYKYWSKSSVYLKAVRDDSISFCLSTWYKYCKLLGYEKRHLLSKKIYSSLTTHKPNEIWCADVTIFKTADGVKHYIHVLMDHFSKKILGYSIEKSNSGKAIRNLLQNAYLKYKPIDTMFLTDGGCENVNSDVSSLLESFRNPIIHRIAQRDVVFSNSMIEAFNKTFKYEFLYPKIINTGTGLKKIVDESIPIYNNHRPQWSLDGNTPSETFSGIPNFNKYKASFDTQKAIRLTQNKDNSCRTCFK